MAVAGAGLGRTVWRAHRNLVTLSVRNAPLAEVLQTIERQTREKIRLVSVVGDVRVKLSVTDKPLPEVLDLLARQVGARPVTVYAVYDSKPALRRLEAALESGTSLESAGWTNLTQTGELEIGALNPSVFTPAPVANSPTGSVRSRPGGVAFSGADIERRIREQLRAQGQEENQIDPEAMAEAMKNVLGQMSSARASNRVVGASQTLRIRSDKDGHTEIRQERNPGRGRLVAESRLASRVADILPLAATPEDAARAARAARGRWTSLYALEKSPPGMALGGFASPQAMPPGAFNPDTRQFTPGDTNAALLELRGHLANSRDSFQARAEQAARSRKLEEFNHLTPEQRVQRTRERRALSQPHP